MMISVFDFFSNLTHLFFLRLNTLKNLPQNKKYRFKIKDDVVWRKNLSTEVKDDFNLYNNDW